MSDMDGRYFTCTNYDASADFSSYDTYFIPDSILIVGDNEEPVYAKNDAARKIIATFVSRMDSCGYTRADEIGKADLGLQLSYIEQTRYFLDYAGSILSRVISVRQMLRNWCVVYLGNFVGAALVAALCVLGHVFSAFDGRLAASVIAIAQTKAALPFGDAFVRGILCNFLVCIAVWMASAARSVPGKIIAVFFPIMTFVVAGFEHSVANMYYLMAGLLTAAQTGAVAEGLTWGGALAGNLLPVTLGNLVGGVLLVGVSAWYLYLKQGKTVVNF